MASGALFGPPFLADLKPFRLEDGLSRHHRINFDDRLDLEA